MILGGQLCILEILYSSLENKTVAHLSGDGEELILSYDPSSPICFPDSLTGFLGAQFHSNSCALRFVSQTASKELSLRQVHKG